MIFFFCLFNQGSFVVLVCCRKENKKQTIVLTCIIAGKSEWNLYDYWTMCRLCMY